jgi:hypothetical protein
MDAEEFSIEYNARRSRRLHLLSNRIGFNRCSRIAEAHHKNPAAGR